MTVLIQEMSATVITAVNEWTLTLADFTVMPKKGVFKTMMDKNPGLQQWLAGILSRKAEEKRVRDGFQIQDPDDIALARIESGRRVDEQEDIAPDARPEDEHEQETRAVPRTIDGDEEDTDHDLARQLAQTIKQVAQDLRAHPPKRYSFEEWVRFTKLIRFSRWDRGQDRSVIEEEVAEQEEEEGLVEWDWLGENSPGWAKMSEAEWLLDRCCESLNRYTRRQAFLVSKGHKEPPGKFEEVDERAS